MPQFIDDASSKMEDVGCYVTMMTTLSDSKCGLVAMQHVSIGQLIHQHLDDVSLVLATLRA